MTNPRGALHPPVEFRGGHNDAPGTVPNVITIDGQPGGSGRGRPARGVSNHMKRGEIGASGDGKLMGPRDEALIEPLAFQREARFCPRATWGTSPGVSRKSTESPGTSMAAGVNPRLSPLNAGDWGKMVSETDSS